MIKDNFHAIVHRFDDAENTALLPTAVNNANLDAIVGLPPIAPMMPYCSSNHFLEAVGLTFEQAQKLNFQKAENAVEFEHKAAMAQLELNLRYHKKLIDDTFKENSTLTNSQSTTNSVSMHTPVSPQEIQASIEAFLSLNCVVKLRSRAERSGWVYYVKNEELNRHTSCTDKELYDSIIDYLWENYPDRDLPQGIGDRIIKNRIRCIHRLEQSCLHPLPDTEAMFANGIYNFMRDEFSPIDNSVNIFTQFSLPSNYLDNFTEPVAFNAMLTDIFDDDNDKIQLLYEVFGAILANKKTLKKIFLFQGVSNGGKTRLAEILLRCIDFDDHADFNTISDITNDSLQKDAQNLKLVYLKDISNRKLGSNQISYLKSYADGGNGDSATSFKILAAANGAITSESDGSISPALRNRLLVVPFAKPMDNSAPQVAAFEDMYLNDELPHIVRKALKAFGEVLKRGGKFIHEYELNDILDTTTFTSTNDLDVIDRLKSIIEENFRFTDEPCTTVDDVFSIVNDIDSNLAGSHSALSQKLKSIFGGQFKKIRRYNTTYFNLSPIEKN